jgi:hypothetical protein
MIEACNLKIAVLSTEIGEIQLRSELDCGFIQPFFFSDYHQMANSFYQENFDMVLVDSFYPECANICQAVYSQLHIPIALWVKPNDLNWSAYNQWHIDGFITRDASKSELLVRLRAISRLCTRLPLIVYEFSH